MLPMQVHGADYAQMGMISNAKATKLVSFKFFIIVIRMTFKYFKRTCEIFSECTVRFNTSDEF